MFDRHTGPLQCAPGWILKMQFPEIPDWIDLRPGAMPRPIARRFRLAWLLARGLLPDFARDWGDDLVVQTADVLRGAQPADTTIAAAINLRAGPPLDPAEVEARLLAGQEPVDVAAAMGMPAAVVATYSKLYFDLAGQTQARSWMMHEGIGSKAFSGLTPGDAGVILKLIGLRHGLGVLEPAVRYYRRGLDLVADLDAVPGLDVEEKAWARSIRFWVAVRSLDPADVVKLRAAFPETERQSTASPGILHPVTFEIAAEAVARAADVARTAVRRPEHPLWTLVEPARTPARRRPTQAARRRTAPDRRRQSVDALVLAGA
jgi:hypothetical protein